MIAMYGGAESWKKAVCISCAMHLLAISAVGAAASNWLEAKPPQEHYIAVDLTPVGNLPSAAVPPNQKAVQSLPASGSQISQPMPIAGQAPAKGAGLSAAGAFVHNEAGSSERGGSEESTESAGQSGGGQIAGAREAAASGTSGEAGVSAADRSVAIDRFLARVEAHKEYPYMALKRNQEGRPVVRVEFDADGNLISARLSASSGVQSLDHAAVKAVRSASPFQHGLGTALSMEVPVRYQLTGG